MKNILIDNVSLFTSIGVIFGIIIYVIDLFTKRYTLKHKQSKALFAWINKTQLVNYELCLQNESTLPFYNVIFIIYSNGKEIKRIGYKTLPPGLYRICILEEINENGDLSIEIYYTDNNHRKWIFDKDKRKVKQLRRDYRNEYTNDWEIVSDIKLMEVYNEVTRFNTRLVETYPEVIINICNNSNLIITDIVATVVVIQGGGIHDARLYNSNDRVSKKILYPGETYDMKLDSCGGGMNMKFGIEVAFNDSKGNNWVKSGNGIYKIVKETPCDYYGLDMIN